jgi:hypothetical protein
MTSRWSHKDLMMYVNDGAIYAVSATAQAAVTSALKGYEEVLRWLAKNGLSADLAKTELITFTKTRANTDLTGSQIWGGCYAHAHAKCLNITTASTVKYLGIYISQDLKWDKHVDTMINRAKSTIRGLSVLGNSIQGLDFMNWRKVYNAIVIPTLTYGVPVWYTGQRQKGLVNRMQVAQNEGLRKMTGVFRTTPIEPLHNLTRVPPISYVLDKLTHSYSLHLAGLPPQCKTRTVLTEDQCHYWPTYVRPPTHLTHISQALGPPTYHPTNLDLCTASSSSWAHPRLHYLPKPPPHIIARYKESWEHQEVSDTHITITHTILQGQHVATYRIIRNKNRITYGIHKGADRTQAMCLAVKHALSHP